MVMALSVVRWRNIVDATRVPGVAPQETTCGEPGPAERPVPGDGNNGIL